MKTLKNLFLILMIITSTAGFGFGQEDDWYTVNSEEWEFDTDECTCQLEWEDDKELFTSNNGIIKIKLKEGVEFEFSFDNVELRLIHIFFDDTIYQEDFYDNSTYDDSVYIDIIVGSEFLNNDLKLQIKSFKIITSISEQSPFSNTKMFDSYGNINIETDLNEYTVSVFTVEGKMIHSQVSYNNTTVNQNFKPGLYIVILETKGVRKTEKILIQ